MKLEEIYRAAKAEIQWAKAKLAAVGYPGVAEVEAAVDRALALFAKPPGEEKPQGAPAPGGKPPAEDPGPFYRALLDHVSKTGPRLVSLDPEEKDGLLIDAPPEREESAAERAYASMVAALAAGPMAVRLGDDGGPVLEPLPAEPPAGFTVALMEQLKTHPLLLVRADKDGTLSYEAVDEAGPPSAEGGDAGA